MVREDLSNQHDTWTHERRRKNLWAVNAGLAVNALLPFDAAA